MQIDSPEGNADKVEPGAQPGMLLKKRNRQFCCVVKNEIESFHAYNFLPYK